ncbi:hypothetical protein Glove_199g54 [Diversispora epigaea]|uniref:Uncharacterized protein n=1 Tax=Diversispora epigaea TaxID=1348612 RepID=A0A397IRA2_9GLOM|nr:hypothetical protein Glove_199g54 [Diversispora epigaea]
MNFHKHYSELLKKLPPSIKKNIWNRLTSRVHNPLSEEQASNHSKSNLDQTEIILDHPRSNLDQTEINLRLNLNQTEIKLLKKLPPSIKKNIWNRLTSRVHNPLSEEQASNHSKSNLDQTEIILDHPRSNLDQTEINLRLNLNQTEINLQVTNSEDEIYARIKEAVETMHQRFIESIQETLNFIKQQKEAEYNQICLDMFCKSTNLFKHTLKKYI